MKCVHFDLRRAIAGRWFLISFLVSLVSLYMSTGDLSYYLIDQIMYPGEYGDHFSLNAAELIVSGLRGDFGMMILPALSALPYAAEALREIKNGVIRPTVFRTGRKNWVIGKTLSTMLSGMMLQLAATVGMLFVLHIVSLLCAGKLFPTGDFTVVIPLLLRRMLCGGIWAGVGCIIAAVTETISAAYLAPLCLCYAMTMISTRFLTEETLLNPINWLMGSIWILLAVEIAIAGILIGVLTRKVNAYV